MVARKSPKEYEKSMVLTPPVSRELSPVGIMEPVAPNELAALEVQELKDRAVALVRELAETRGSRQLELTDGLTNLGLQAQRTAGKELDLLRGRLGDMRKGSAVGADITKDMAELRSTLNQINPAEAGKGGLLRRTLAFVPFVGNPAVRALERIAVRYEPVYKEVSTIELRLREGRAMLARDNVELRKLYEQVEQQQLVIRKNAYLTELVIREVGQSQQLSEDTQEKERFRNLLHDVSMRAQDLRTMEEVHIQFFVSIEMTRQNNNRLGQSVERTLALGTNVVMVGLAIQSALARQSRVMEATQRTREFLGNLIVANAAAIRHHTQEIGDIYNDPVIAIEKITQAHNDLIEAMNEADKLKQEGIDSARENIAKLSQLSTDLQQRSRGLREQAQEAPSVEA